MLRDELHYIVKVGVVITSLLENKNLLEPRAHVGASQQYKPIPSGNGGSGD